mmetsp:Transcript_1835/g.4695  ORF Transcript_1835/g.4695 Transcript_1835/m.4695 type:complete len:178 (+) Transcript_1835:102-635(+)
MLRTAPQRRLQALILGLDGIGKRPLADAIIASAKHSELELDVLVANQLPLPADPAQARHPDRIDVVIMMVDMRSKLSLERLAQCTSELDPTFSLARLVLVVCGVDTPANFAVALVEVSKLVEAFNMQVHYCSPDDPDALRITGDRLVKSAAATRRTGGRSPLFLSSLDVDLVRKTSL